MPKEVNYRKLFAIQNKLSKIIKEACPQMDNESGIYFYTREDENGGHCYIGKAVNLLQRNISHLQGYTQRIDISIKKRGFLSPQNKSGWKLNFIHFPEEQLDEKERFYIESYRNAGYDMYNIESGGTDGKQDINQRKEGHGYREGIARGYEKLRKELNEIIDKYLVISLKKDNKLSQKMLDKFNRLLKGEK